MQVTFGKRCSNGIGVCTFWGIVASPFTPTFVAYVEPLAFTLPPSGTWAAEKACGIAIMSSLSFRLAGSAIFLICAPFALNCHGAQTRDLPSS
jgi:hypothetical protein